VTDVVVCADFGSTYTKLAAIDSTTAALLATAEHPTTVDTDVMVGYDAALATIAEALPGRDLTDVLSCSSAGGGLRVAVVGQEWEVTAEAGQRVAASAGAKVIHVVAGLLDSSRMAELMVTHPDVLLLSGGTDGGNPQVLLHNARALADHQWKQPVVIAGNIDARDEVLRVLTEAGVTAVATANVLPDIGVLDPGPAREVIREVFLRHVIGGKGLSSDPRFAAALRAATPDAVLAAVEALAGSVGDVVVVDIGGATTDVYSVVTPVTDDGTRQLDIVATMPRSRTVEGDLGMRWGAAGVVEAAVAGRLLAPGEDEALGWVARRYLADPRHLPGTAAEWATDRRIAELAVTTALRRHCGRQELVYDGGVGTVRRTGKDLRRVGLVVGSGGVLRHTDPQSAAAMLGNAMAPAPGWLLPEPPHRVVIDRHYVLAAAGLLALDHRRALAVQLLDRYLGFPIG
jgi:uncharacterized protein (TIGR01319 family)